VQANQANVRSCRRAPGIAVCGNEIAQLQTRRRLVTICAAAPRPHIGEMWDSLSTKCNVYVETKGRKRHKDRAGE
jgi:hypothetical protein